MTYITKIITAAQHCHIYIHEITEVIFISAHTFVHLNILYACTHLTSPPLHPVTHTNEGWPCEHDCLWCVLWRHHVWRNRRRRQLRIVSVSSKF